MPQQPHFPMGSDLPEGEHVYNEDGVDLTLLRWALSLSMKERLRIMQDYVHTLMAMRNAAKITRIS